MCIHRTPPQVLDSPMEILRGVKEKAEEELLKRIRGEVSGEEEERRRTPTLEQDKEEEIPTAAPVRGAARTIQVIAPRVLGQPCRIMGMPMQEEMRGRRGQPPLQVGIAEEEEAKARLRRRRRSGSQVSA